MDKRKLARRIALVYDEINPWDFRDAWTSITECTKCTLGELESDPVVIWNFIDDMMEAVENDDPIYDELVSLQCEVGEIVSDWLEAKGQKPLVIIA